MVGEAAQLANLGFYKSIGMNRALSHWRLELPDGQEIHVQEQVAEYKVHWDYISLRRDPIGHGIRDLQNLPWRRTLPRQWSRYTCRPHVPR